MVSKLNPTPGLPFPGGEINSWAISLISQLMLELSYNANRSNSLLAGDGTEAATGPVRLKAYTVSTLPTAASYPGGIIYVTNGTLNKRLAISDGTNWRWPDGNIVS